MLERVLFMQKIQKMGMHRAAVPNFTQIGRYMHIAVQTGILYYGSGEAPWETSQTHTLQQDHALAFRHLPAATVH
jgi:hypothetical protein